MISKFEFPFIAPGLNGSKGLIRMNRFKRQALKKKIDKMVFDAWDRKRHEGKIKITYIRFSTHLMDKRDNLPATQKFWIDALVRNTIIQDDSPEFVSKDSQTLQEKVRHRNQCRTVIIVEDV